MRFLIFLSIAIMAISCGPSADSYIAEGNIKMDSADYVGAIADFTDAIEKDAENEKAYILRGDAKNAMGLTDEALSDWDAALELNPKNDSVYVKKANLFNTKEMWNEAITATTFAISINPKNVLAFEEQGYSYFNQSKYDEAIVNYNKMLEIDSNQSIAYYNIGTAYQNMQKYDEAEKNYIRAKEMGYNEAKIDERLAGINETRKKQRIIARNTYKCAWCNKNVLKTNAYSEEGNHYSTAKGQFSIDLEVKLDKKLAGSNSVERMFWLGANHLDQPHIFCSYGCSANFKRNN